jgi:hypothetical protein
MYKKGEYDLAGFSVGAVKRSEILPQNIIAGDMLIGTYHSSDTPTIHRCGCNSCSLPCHIISDPVLSCPVQHPPGVPCSTHRFLLYAVSLGVTLLPALILSKSSFHFNSLSGITGLRSSGVHSNGYSLVRKCVEKSGSRPCTHLLIYMPLSTSLTLLRYMCD